MNKIDYADLIVDVITSEHTGNFIEMKTHFKLLSLSTCYDVWDHDLKTINVNIKISVLNTIKRLKKDLYKLHLYNSGNKKIKTLVSLSNIEKSKFYTDVYNELDLLLLHMAHCHTNGARIIGAKNYRKDERDTVNHFELNADVLLRLLEDEDSTWIFKDKS